MEFLQRLVVSEGTTETFPPNFPYAICQALALPLAEPGMSRVYIMRSVYTVAAAGVEVMVIVCLMNSQQERLLTIMGGVPVAILIAEVEPEDFDFEGNLNSKS